MTTALDVLILDDRPEDAELMIAELRRAGYDPTWKWVDTEEEYLAGLNRDFDVILADYSMPGFGAMRALELLHEQELDIPFIIVTGELPDDVAAETVGMGVDDYLLKDRLARLGSTVERVLHERHARKEKRAVETALLVSETRASELAELSRIISSTGNIADVFPLFADHVKKLIAFDRISISVVDWRRRVIVDEFIDGFAVEGVKVGHERSLDEFALLPALERGESRVLSEGDIVALARDYQYVARWLAVGLKCAIFVPMRSGDQTIGALVLRSKLENAYSEQDLEVAEHVAAQIAGAIANDQLRKIAEEEARQRSVLAEISRVMSSSLDPPDQFNEFAQCVDSLVRTDRLSLAVWDEDSQRARVLFNRGIDIPHAGPGCEFHVPVGRYTDPENKRKSTIVDMKTSAEAGYQPAAWALDAGIQSGLIVPIVWGQKTVGYLFGGALQTRAFTTEDQRIIEEVSAQIAGAVANTQTLVDVTRESEDRATLAAIGRLVSSSTEIGEVDGAFSEKVNRLVPHDRIVIALLEDDDKLIVTFVAGLEVPERNQGQVIPLSDTLTDHVARVGSTVVYNADSPSELKQQFPDRTLVTHKTFCSVVLVPLKTQDRIIGSLHLWSKHPDAYGNKQVAIAEEVANQIAGAVANDQLRKIAQQEAQRHAVLAKIGRIISAESNLDDVYPKFARLLRTLIRADRIVIRLVDSEGTGYTTDFTDGFGGDHNGIRTGATGLLRGTTTEEVLLSGKPLVVNEQNRKEMAARFPHLNESFGEAYLSGVLVPMISSNRVIGVLHASATQENVYGPREVELIEEVASQIAGAIANAQSRQRAEEAHVQLAMSEENYRNLVETSHDLIWSCDAEGRFTYLNPAWERTHGYAPVEMLGRPFSDFQSPEIAERDKREFGRHLAGGSVLDYETTHISKSGEEITLLFNAFPVTNTDGEIVSTRGTARDVTGERKAQAGLRVRAAVVEASGDAMVVADIAGVIMLVNHASEAMFGRSREELVGSSITELMPTKQHASHTSGPKHTGEEGGAPDIGATLIETDGVRADGTLFPIELRLSKISDIGPATFVAVIRDITDRRNLEAEVRTHHLALAESDALYRDLYDNAPDMYTSVDAATGKVVECNNTLLSVLGYERSEVIGMPVLNLYSPESEKQSQQYFLEFQVTGNISDVELKLKRKDGTTFFASLSVSAVRDAEGNIKQSRSTLRDITKHKKAEEELRIRVAALDAAADMVVITDSAGTIEYINRAFTEETGYEPGDVIGGNPNVVSSGRQDRDYYRDLWNTITAGKVWNGTVINRRKDGSEYPEEMSITPVIGDDGELLRFIAIKRNITEQLERQQERESRIKTLSELQELQKVEQVRSQFLTLVSHELRTPLTSVTAFADILRRNSSDNLTERQQQQIQIISKSARLLAQIVDDLVDVSRSDSGGLSIVRARFNISQLVLECTEGLAPLFKDKSQTLDVKQVDRHLVIDADRDRISQVLINLLTNASKYSPEGATITLSIGTSGGRLDVSVSDSGIGIDEEDLQQLFTPFFRANNAETRKQQGTGLGLHIVRAIVELHGGTVEINSKRHEGTVVRFRIPGADFAEQAY